MPDQPNTPETGSKPAEAQKPEFQPITSQEQLNALLGDRLARERAKFADYDELKAKATKFDQAEQASKTELEKAVEANAKLRIELDSYRAREQVAQWASEVSEATGIPATVLRGSNKDELEAHAAELQKLIGARRRGGNDPVPSQGTGDPRRSPGGYRAGAERAKARYRKQKH